jgi:hypothetical protein
MYSKDKYRADGLSCACKECRKKENIEYKKKGGLKKLINQDHKPWFKCSSCMATIGLGHKKAAKILVHLSPGQIYGAWNRGGVSVQTPACGSWRIYASRVRKGLPTDRKQNEAEIAYAQGRMDDIRTTARWGFDWRYEWQKFRASQKYSTMTQDEKDKHNKRCHQNKLKRWQKNPELMKADKERITAWKKANPEKHLKSVNKSVRKRRKNDPAFRMQCNMRRRYGDIMKTTKKGGSTKHVDDLGCNTKDFNKHLESKFTKGMTWDNYGEYWHLDHILPCASFDHEDEAQRKVCWHWTNFQPLEAKDNMAKSDTITEPQMNLLMDYA